MRHLWSLLSALAASAVALVLFAIDLHGGDPRVVVGRIAAVGLVLGGATMIRTSPVGPIVGGLLLLTPAVLMLFAKSAFISLFGTVMGDAAIGGIHLSGAELATASGYLAMAGAMMITAAISVQRWRAGPKPVAALVDNGPAGEPNQAHDGTTAQLWV